MDQVREIADQEPTPLSLQQMRSFAYGDAKLRIVSAKFLHKELQSRFARYDQSPACVGAGWPPLALATSRQYV
jgi:hypothetical protein